MNHCVAGLSRVAIREKAKTAHPVHDRFIWYVWQHRLNNGEIRCHVAIIQVHPTTLIYNYTPTITTKLLPLLLFHNVSISTVCTVYLCFALTYPSMKHCGMKDEFIIDLKQPIHFDYLIWAVTQCAVNYEVWSNSAVIHISNI